MILLRSAQLFSNVIFPHCFDSRHVGSHYGYNEIDRGDNDNSSKHVGEV